MAFKSINNLRDSVAGILSGLDLNNVDNLYGAFERAARTLCQKADIDEASGIQNITLYSGVYDYPCDHRIFGSTVTDVRPQGVSRNPNDFVYKKSAELFDRTKGYLPNGTMLNFTHINGDPIVRIKTTKTIQQVIIDQMNSTTGWTAGGTASSLVTDTAIYYQQPSSLRFNITTGTSTLTKTLSPQNIASYQNFGVGFMAFQIPTGATATDLTSIDLKIGSDASNYDHVTSTQGFLGAWTAGDWLLVPFDFSIATHVGTADWTKIAYTQVTLVCGGSFTNFHVGGLWLSFPSQNQIYYQTAAIFMPVNTTTQSTTITANTDQITLSDPAFTLYEYEASVAVLQQTGAGAGDATLATLHEQLHGVRARNGMVVNLGLYDHYRGDNPSEELRTVGTYYDQSSYNSI